MASIPGTIFINYRKDDSSWNALALYNELQKYFAKDQIFKDFNTILPGDDFVNSIDNALRKCDVLIVVIGKHWLDIKDAAGKRRLDDKDDFVRLEVATALARNIQVIPVLFDGTPMPRSEDLPDDLRSLYRRQFIEIDSKRFDDDVRNLAEAIKKILPDGVMRVPPEQKRADAAAAEQRQQAYQNYQSTSQAKPDNNLVYAIISTVLCCLPLGIVSILSATKVDSLWNSGREAEAVAEAKKAKQWAIYAAIAAAVGWFLYLMIFALAGDY
jgi:hypothetical protein